MQKHNPIQDLVNATQRNLQYTAEANALLCEALLSFG